MGYSPQTRRARRRWEGEAVSCGEHTFVYCTSCYRDVPARTALQEAVLRAAVAWRCDHNLDELQALVKLDVAVDALLAAEPAWGEGR